MLKYWKFLLSLIFIVAIYSAFLLSPVSAVILKSRYNGNVEKGGKLVKVSIGNSFKLVESYPESTVTVYDTGTTNLVNLWSDRDGVFIKANPFTANNDGSFFFYVDCGKYDIKYSGTGIAAPYTEGDVFICGDIGTGNIRSINELTAPDQFLIVGTAGTDFNIDSTTFTDTHIFNLPSASVLNRGAVTTIAQTFGGKKTFTPTSSVAGINVGSVAAEPSTLTNGDIWYDSIEEKFKCYEDGSAVDCIQASSGTGITSINALTATAQFLVVGTAGSDFNIVSSVATHTFNLPDAGFAARGVVNTTTQTFNGDKTFDDTVTISSNIANSFIYSSSGKVVLTTIAPTNGQLLIGSTGLAPVVANISGTSPIVVTNGAGSITLSCPTCTTSGPACSSCTFPHIPYASATNVLSDSIMIYGKPDANSIDLDLPAPGPKLYFGRGNPDYNGSFTSVSYLTPDANYGIAAKVGGGLMSYYSAYGFIAYSNTGAAISAAMGGPGVVMLTGGVEVNNIAGYYFSPTSDPTISAVLGIAKDRGDDFAVPPSVADEAIEINAGIGVVGAGVAGYRDLKLRAIKLHTGTKPTCALNERGKIFYVAGGAGVADTLEICRKDAADAYAWATLY